MSAAADQALKGHAAAMGDILDDYLSLRMIAIEEKVCTYCILCALCFENTTMLAWRHDVDLSSCCACYRR